MNKINKMNVGVGTETVLLKEATAMERYEIGRTLLRQIGEKAGAMVRITPRCLRYKREKLDAYFAQFEKTDAALTDAE